MLIRLIEDFKFQKEKHILMCLPAHSQCSASRTNESVEDKHLLRLKNSLCLLSLFLYVQENIPSQNGLEYFCDYVIYRCLFFFSQSKTHFLIAWLVHPVYQICCRWSTFLPEATGWNVSGISIQSERIKTMNHLIRLKAGLFSWEEKHITKSELHLEFFIWLNIFINIQPCKELFHSW